MHLSFHHVPKKKDGLCRILFLHTEFSSTIHPINSRIIFLQSHGKPQRIDLYRFFFNGYHPSENVSTLRIILPDETIHPPLFHQHFLHPESIFQFTGFLKSFFIHGKSLIMLSQPTYIPGFHPIGKKFPSRILIRDIAIRQWDEQ